MNVYVARQPIFDKQEKIYAYELLFRAGLENVYTAVDGNRATKEVINTAFGVIGLKELVGTKRAFINFTGALIKEKIASLLPKNALTVEILENIEPDREIIEACRELKQKGYQLALDDFVLADKFRPLVEIADIIKVDFLTTPLEKCRALISQVQQICREPKIYLAEKVENRDVFEKSKAIGYALFQGYFFSKPEIRTGKEIPANKLTYLSILKELYTAEPDFNKIEELMKRDVAISYKLLKLVNSASLGLMKKVTSLKHALVLLGLAEVRKWISLVALSSLGQGKPDELMRTSIIRARFGELFAMKVGLAARAPEIFLMGLFSMIDAFLDKPMEQVIKDLPLSLDVRNVLLKRPSGLTPVSELIIAYEKGIWDTYEAHMAAIGLDSLRGSDLMPELYFDALKWSDELLNTNLS